MNDIKALRREITHLNEVLHRKNIMLSALQFVWCKGGCLGGVHGEVNEEVVLAAEKNTHRLRTWWKNKQFKARWKAMLPDERIAWVEHQKDEYLWQGE